MRNIVWSWRNAAFGALISSVGALVIVFGNVQNGLNLLTGAIPAAILGLPPRRVDRRRVIVIGVLFAVSVLVGSVLAQWTATAIVGMFLMGLGAALLATRRVFGYAVMTVCLPLAATGLTFDGLDESAGVSAIFLLGSAIAFVVALCFPDYEAPDTVAQPLMTLAQAQAYGVRLGLAAAVATALGIYFGADHLGWIVISTVIVMRPAHEMHKLRSIGRAMSVFVGAIVAAWLLAMDLRPAAIAIVAAGAIIGAAATNASRWYVTPAFTTFLILWCAVYDNATIENISYRSWERVFDTLLGVGIAYFFGLLVPKVLQDPSASVSATPSAHT